MARSGSAALYVCDERVVNVSQLVRRVDIEAQIDHRAGCQAVRLFEIIDQDADGLISASELMQLVESVWGGMDPDASPRAEAELEREVPNYRHSTVMDYAHSGCSNLDSLDVPGNNDTLQLYRFQAQSWVTSVQLFAGRFQS